MSVEWPGSEEALRFESTLWSSPSSDIAVIRPLAPLIPLAEGNHLVVAPSRGEITPWQEQDPHQLLREAYFAAGVAKVMAEGKDDPALWVNIHGDRAGVSVYGRNPASEVAWGKPVVKRDTDFSFPPHTSELRHAFSHYLPLWERNLPDMVLFPDGIEPVDLQSKEFRQEAAFCDTKNESLVWSTDKFSLVRIRKQHLTGSHFVVHGREAFWEESGGFHRPWQTRNGEDSRTMQYVQGYLEGVAILKAAQDVLSKDPNFGSVMHNPEFHYSSNWSWEFKPHEQGGKVDMERAVSEDPIQRKAEKRLHRIGAHGIDSEGNHITGDEINTAVHGHLYASDNDSSFVSLPSRPQAEVPEEWEEIIPLPEELVKRADYLLGESLTREVASLQGSLV